MDNYYYKCHQCGKCCNSCPELEISEILKYSSIFPLAVRLESSYGYEKYSHDQILSKKEQLLFKDGYYINLCVFGYDYLSTKKCSQLQENGSCGIYLDRPNVCKVVPTNIFFPEKIKIYSEGNYEIFKKEGCIKNTEEHGFIPIYEENSIRKDLIQFIKISNEEKSKYSKERLLALEMFTAIIPNLLQNARNGWVSINLIMFLHVLKELNIFSDEEYKTIIKNQINILNKIINEAIIRKNKEDVKQTREYRVFLDLYNKALKS